MDVREKYDRVYSRSYDLPLLAPAAEERRTVVEELRLEKGATVLEPGCGTGSNFPFLVEAVGPEGRVIGIDFSEGMLEKARERLESEGWENVALLQADAGEIGPGLLNERFGVEQVDAVLFSLVLAIAPEWERVFEAGFSCLRRGGRCVVWDTRTADRGLRRLLNPAWVMLNRMTAAGDPRRRTWEVLDGRCEEVRTTVWRGGFVFVTSGVKV
jgi:phosphatidylethanolamine/phosphatidyl-N-methylethanolamine N-methyltransferase